MQSNVKKREPFSRLSNVKPLYIDDDGDFEKEIAGAMECATISLKRLTGSGANVRVEEFPHSLIIASIAEPVRGEGGIRVSNMDCLKAFSELDFPLIMDEIQSGLGRCGKFLASEGISADYYTFSKSLGGNYERIAALLVDKQRYKLKFGEKYSSTFANGGMATTVAKRVLEIIRDEDIPGKARERGEALKGRLLELKAKYPEIIHGVEGTGLMLGLHFKMFGIENSPVMRMLHTNDILGYFFAAYLLKNHNLRILPSISAPGVLRLEPSVYRNRIVQVGTQQRSSPIQAQAKQFLHDDQGIGQLTHVVVSRVGERKPIGRRDLALSVPTSVDYNLWLGPAEDQSLYRDKLHYDWHWDFNTGNGEMGNWGVHIVDDVLNVALQDRAGYPSTVRSAGMRVAWHDAADTPNVHVARFENSVLPVSMVLSNIVPADALYQGAQYQGFGSGYTVYGEGGRYEGTRGGGRAFDADGNLIKAFKGSSNNRHAQGFVDAIRTRDESKLTATLEIGHVSTAWCHLACIAALEGHIAEQPEAKGPDDWLALLDGYRQHVISIDSEATIAPAAEIEIDPQTGEVGNLTSEAAKKLVKRVYRSSEWEEQFKA